MKKFSFRYLFYGIFALLVTLIVIGLLVPNYSDGPEDYFDYAAIEIKVINNALKMYKVVHVVI